ncbi:MAG: thiamine-phosphate kinase [Gemmatimonadaceae bacterium]|nr:thiamine-phosphate kinase [Gemmatimonadaceae bacterium]
MSDTPHRPHQAMGPGREFDTIRMLMARWGDLAVDIGDDAAVLPEVGGRQRVVSTDACVEGAHFLRAWITPREVGVRAAAAAFSDLAAMGAQADALLAALAVSDAWIPSLGELAEGIGEVVRASGAKIIGGNLSRSATLAVTSTVIGSALRPVGRRGAQPGDVVVVTGRLGGPGSAIAAWYANAEPSAWARARFAAPVPRLAEGQRLAAAGARAMLDISDGLVADARHLAAASGVRVVIDADAVPRGEGISLESAMASGEEYELLAALPQEALASLQRDWASSFDVPLTVIGRVDGFADGGEVRITDGISPPRVEITSGHDHFSG